MPTHDFSPLYDKYESLIADMPEVFTTHKFILRLAQENQKPYTEALYAYRNRKHRGKHTPFQIVHGILARHLNAFPKLIRLQRRTVSSPDIFGGDNTCAQWRKVQSK